MGRAGASERAGAAIGSGFGFPTCQFAGAVDKWEPPGREGRGASVCGAVTPRPARSLGKAGNARCLSEKIPHKNRFASPN